MPGPSGGPCPPPATSTGVLLLRALAGRPGFWGHPDFWPGLERTFVAGNAVAISGSWSTREPSGPILVGSPGRRWDI